MANVNAGNKDRAVVVTREFYYQRSVAAGTRGVITSVESHGSAPYTRYGVQFRDGTVAYGVDPANLGFTE